MSEKKEVNILTIDFDYIMFPCIKLYNDLCGGDANPTEVWDIIEHERRINNHISYDANALQCIAKILKGCLAVDGCKLHTVTEHQELIKEVGITTDEDNIEYNITNIDFHHDIYYRPEDVATLSYFNDYNCSNWLGYINYIGKLKSYTWYQAPTSDPIMLDRYDDELSEKITIKLGKRLNEFMESCLNKDITFDHVVFCLSPQWVPYRYHHLFYMLSDIFTESGDKS